MHDYWCRAEYEILVSELGAVTTDKAEKIDIWRQLDEYVNLKCDLKF